MTAANASIGTLTRNPFGPHQPRQSPGRGWTPACGTPAKCHLAGHPSGV